MAPSSRATLARRLLAVVVAAALTLAAIALLGADRLGFGTASADEMPTPQVQDAALAGLDATLAERVSAAREAAADDGVPLVVTSGGRTVAEQQRLFDDGVAEHGSVEAATRWVLPPDRSAHVQGLAVDVGPAEGWQWLGVHGATYGLCRVYENEPWHFEPLTEPGGTCPALLPDASWSP